MREKQPIRPTRPVGRATLTTALLVLATTTAVASAAAAPPIEVTDHGAVFPLDDSFPRPTVPVRIGDRGPFPFLLDTGAGGTSIIDEGLAAELGLRTLGTRRISSPMGPGVENGTLVAVTDVHVGPLSVPDLQATTFDLRGLLERALGAAAHEPGGDAGDGAPAGPGGMTVPLGVLGTTDLGERIVTFDVGARRVEITAGALPPPDGLTIFEYDDMHPAVPVQVGARRFDVHVDTGSPGGISLPLSLAKELPLQGEPTPIGEARLVDATVTVHGAKLDGVMRVGGIELENPDLAFLEGSPVGNLGNEFLAQCVLTVDARHRRVRLVPAEAREAPEAVPVRRTVAVAKGRKRYGIRFAGGVGGSPIPVAGVDEGSLAQDAGLRAGDLIEQLNGVGVEKLDQADRIAALRGSPLEMLVRRGDEIVALSMRLD